MKFIGHRGLFRGELNGKTATDLRKLEYELDTLEQRRESVERLVGETGVCKDFYDEYIEEYYKCNTSNELTEDINVFKNIENMGTYLLNSRDLPREKKQEYKIYTDEQLFKKSLMECNSVCSNGDQEIDQEQMIHYLLANKRNEYYPKVEKITDSDLEHEKLKEVLCSYNEFYLFLKEELLKIRNKQPSKLSLYQITSIMKNVKDDMILSKQQLLNIINFDPMGDFTPFIDWEQFDFKNKEHIKAALYLDMEHIVPDDDVSLIAYDVNSAIKKLYKQGTLNKTDIKIIEQIRLNKSYTLQEIGQEFNVSQQAISKRINKISEKISNYFK
ncbi:MAG: AsnC family protein [Bacilli bacterium]|uniref:AsnC family protein n=1 Tax=Clostridium sp. TaxID=1506 RepID=UPI002FC642F2